MSSVRLAEALKRIASDTMDNSNPADVFYGEVKSMSPLKIEAASLMLDDECVHICQGALKRSCLETCIREDPPEQCKGIKAGDIVALLRLHGGQDFLLIDKVVSI